MLQQLWCIFWVSPILEAQLHTSLRVISPDAEHTLELRVALLDLVQLCGVVKKVYGQHDNGYLFVVSIDRSCKRIAVCFCTHVVVCCEAPLTET